MCRSIYSVLRQLRISWPILGVGGSSGNLHIPATIRGWIGNDTFHLPIPFKRIAHGGAHGALSILQRILGQIYAPYRSINPVWLLISKLLNFQSGSSRLRCSGPHYYLSSPRREVNLYYYSWLTSTAATLSKFLAIGADNWCHVNLQSQQLFLPSSCHHRKTEKSAQSEK